MKKNYYTLLILLLCLPVLAHQYIKNFTPEIERIETLTDLNVKESFAPEIATFQNNTPLNFYTVHLYSDNTTTLNDIEPKGNNVTWYDAETKGKQLNKSTKVENTKFFYAQIKGESSRRPVQTLSYQINQDYCNIEKLSDIAVPNSYGLKPAFFHSETDNTALDMNTKIKAGSNSFYIQYNSIPYDFALDTPYAFSLLELPDQRILVAKGIENGSGGIDILQENGTNKKAFYSIGTPVIGMELLSNGEILVPELFSSKINKLNKNGVLIKSNFIEDIPMPMGLLEVDPNLILVGSHSTGEIRSYDKNGKFKSIFTENTSSTRTIIKTTDNNVWVANTNGWSIVRYDSKGKNEKKFIVGRSPASIAEVTPGILWISFTDGTIKQMNTNESDSNSPTTLKTIFENLGSLGQIIKTSNNRILVANPGKSRVLEIKNITSNRVKITVNVAVSAPKPPRIFLYNKATTTLKDITPGDSSLNWHSSSSEEQVLPDTTLLVNNTTYYSTPESVLCNGISRSLTTTIKYEDTYEACNGQTLTDLNIPSPQGYKMFFFKTSSSTIPLATNTLLASGNYYIELSSLDGNNASNRVKINVNVIRYKGAPAPSVYLYNNDITTLKDIKLEDENALWYSSETETTPLKDTTPLQHGTTYYAAYKLNKCASLTRQAITTLKYDDKQEICYGVKPSDLNLPTFMGSYPLLYESKTETTAIDKNTSLKPGTYYAEFHKTNEFASGFSNPYSLAELKDGRILVGSAYLDGKEENKHINQVQADGSDTKLFAKFTEQGSVNSIIQLANGDILASNYKKNRVERFNKNGQLINDSFIKDTDAPYGLIETTSNTILVASYRGGRIDEYNQDGTKISTLVDNLTSPEVIKRLSDNSIWTAEQRLNAITKVDLTGNNNHKRFTFFGEDPNNFVEVSPGILWITFTNGDIMQMSMDDPNPDNPTLILVAKNLGNFKNIIKTTTGKILAASWEHNKVYEIVLHTSNRVKIEVTAATPAPIIPDNTLTACISNAPTLGSLEAGGLELVWYDSIDGDTPLDADKAVADGDTYYAAQRLNNCESFERTLVKIVVENPIVVFDDAEITFNYGQEVSDIYPFKELEGFSETRWYATESATNYTTAIPETAKLNVGKHSYWVSGVTSNGCEGERVEIVFNITPSELTITADPNSKIYGQVDPELTYTVKGLMPYDQEDKVLTGKIERQKGEDVATYDILQGSLEANDNYILNYKKGTFNITPAELTITADPNSKIYGQVDPELTYEVIGLLPNDKVEDNIAGALERESGENVGTYKIGQGSLTINSNYILKTFNEADFEIKKADQTIDFKEIGTIVFEDTPTLQLTATASSGLKVSFSIAELDVAELDANDILTFLRAGTLTVTATQEGNHNYNPAEPVVRVIDITSRDASIWDLIVDGVSYGRIHDEVYITIDCDPSKTQVTLEVITQFGAQVDPDHYFVVPLYEYGMHKQLITVTSANGAVVKTYTIWINRHIPTDNIVFQKYNNVLLVNNNPMTNDGYRFIAYTWYKNGQVIGDKQLYSAGDVLGDVLDPNAEYRVELTLQDGRKVMSCPIHIQNTPQHHVTIYPNPVQKNSMLSIRFSQQPLQNTIDYIIYDVRGMQITQGVLAVNNLEILIPSTIATGSYFLVLDVDGQQRSIQFIVRD